MQTAHRASACQDGEKLDGLSGEGPVYLATTADGSEVAIMLPPGAYPGGAGLDCFVAEAAAARRVTPFCAARLLDAGTDAGRPFLVSEYVAGPSLAELVTSAGPVAAADLAALAIGCATGLAAVHQAGLVHGSFGPGHVILGSAGPRLIGYAITPALRPGHSGGCHAAWARTVGYVAAGSTPAGPGTSGLQVPAAVAGTRAGQVRQDNPADVVAVRVSLAAGARSGTIDYSGVSFASAGRLRTLPSRSAPLVLDQVITAGRRSCADGVVTLRPAAGALTFSFRGKAGPAARGTLTRQ